VLNVYSNRCVGLPGYIVNDDGTVRECSVDKFCINNVERDWWAAPPCRAPKRREM
jgi:hypothetical protein